MNCWYRIPLLRALPIKNSSKKQGLTIIKHKRGKENNEEERKYTNS